MSLVVRILLLSAVGLTVCYSQAESGRAGTVRIHGIVRDAVGTGLRGAAVKLILPAGGQVAEVRTAPGGEFEFSVVQLPRYELIIEASCCGSFRKSIYVAGGGEVEVPTIVMRPPPRIDDFLFVFNPEVEYHPAAIPDKLDLAGRRRDGEGHF